MSDLSDIDEALFEISGGWAIRTVELGERSIEITLPADPDCVLEAQIERSEDANSNSGEPPDPYWAALWSSAIPTAEALLRSSWAPGTSALEIGCGIGLVGIAALMRGLDLAFSDHIAEALAVAKYNAGRNGFPDAPTLLFDWNEPPPRASYPVILASDVLYNIESHRLILKMLRRMLAPGGECWIGDPGRFNSREFFKLATTQFSVELRDRDGLTFELPQVGAYQLFVLRHLGAEPRMNHQARSVGE